MLLLVVARQSAAVPMLVAALAVALCRPTASGTAVSFTDDVVGLCLPSKAEGIKVYVSTIYHKLQENSKFNYAITINVNISIRQLI